METTFIPTSVLDAAQADLPPNTNYTFLNYTNYTDIPKHRQSETPISPNNAAHLRNTD